MLDSAKVERKRESIQLTGSNMLLDPGIVKETRSGIVIAATNETRKNYTEGEIIAIGPDVTKYSVGQSVLFLNETQAEFERRNKHYWMIKEGAVIARLFETEDEPETTGDDVFEFLSPAKKEES